MFGSHSQLLISTNLSTKEDKIREFHSPAKSGANNHAMLFTKEWNQFYAF